MCVAIAPADKDYHTQLNSHQLIIHRVTEFINVDYQARNVLISLDFFVENRAADKHSLLFVHRGAVDVKIATQAWHRNWNRPEDQNEDPLCLRTIAFHSDWDWHSIVSVPSLHGICKYNPSSAVVNLVIGGDDEHRPYSLFELGPFEPKTHSISRVTFYITGECYNYLLNSCPRFVVEGGEIVIRKIMQKDLELCSSSGKPDFCDYKVKFREFYQLWNKSTAPLRYEVVLWANDPSLLPKIVRPCEMRELHSDNPYYAERTRWLIAPEVNRFQLKGTVSSGDFVVCTF